MSKKKCKQVDEQVCQKEPQDECKNMAGQKCEHMPKETG